MATLEKIRSKSVILFTVIIVALLAFILGDAFTSSRSFFGPGTTAAKVADRKIDIQEFNRQVEQQREALQAQGMTNVDHAMIQNQVLQQMLFKEVLDKEIDALGITVTDSELSSAMTGATPLATVTQTVQQMGFPDAASFYDYAFNPAKYNVPANYAPQLQAMWINLENQVAEQLRQQKLGSLFSGALKANKLDAKSYYDENATTAKVRYVKKDFSTIADSTAQIMNSDVANLYNSRKNLYELAEETRPIDYIVVDIVPSEDDYLAAQKEVEDALVALREQPGTEGVSGNLNFVVNRKSASEGKLASNVKNELEALRTEGVKLLSFNNDKYTIAKLVNTFDDVDDVTIEYLAVTAPVAQRDSVIALLNGGADLDALVEQGFVQGTPQEETVSLLDPNYASFKDALLSQPIGTYFLPAGSENSQVAGAVKVVSRTAPQPIYDIAEITYVVEPSNATI
ncbi:MAG: SurA N-terminal domain-containing protein, partial [Muribaculaceae bacterium]|nr:SurA N-terminal domain-containing protein [Muribaculaceae bacterium]